mgnify:CR=1 FL=1
MGKISVGKLDQNIPTEQMDSGSSRSSEVRAAHEIDKEGSQGGRASSISKPNNVPDIDMDAVHKIRGNGKKQN